MIFRPLALVAAIAGLSSAEVSYSIKEELLASSNGNGSGQYEMDVDSK